MLFVLYSDLCNLYDLEVPSKTGKCFAANFLTPVANQAVFVAMMVVTPSLHSGGVTPKASHMGLSIEIAYA